MIDAPAPSRTEIIEMLENSAKPLQRRDIITALEVESDDSRDILRRRWRAMVRDGQLSKTRRNASCLPCRLAVLTARSRARSDGSGCVALRDVGP